MNRARDFLKELKRQPNNYWLVYSACKHVAENDPTFDELPLQGKISYFWHLVRDLSPEVQDTIREGVIEYQLTLIQETREENVS